MSDIQVGTGRAMTAEAVTTLLRRVDPRLAEADEGVLLLDGHEIGSVFHLGDDSGYVEALNEYVRLDLRTVVVVGGIQKSFRADLTARLGRLVLDEHTEDAAMLDDDIVLFTRHAGETPHVELGVPPPLADLVNA